MAVTPRSGASAWQDLWAGLQARGLRLEVTVVLLSALTLGLAGLLGWTLLRPAPIYYIPATAGPGLLQPGVIPDTLLTDFAGQVLLILYNVTPATAKTAYREVEKYLAARFLTSFRVRAEQEAKAIEAQQLASQLGIQATEVVGRTPLVVKVTGLRRVYVGQLPVRDEVLEARVTLARVPAGPLNPYGLVVANLDVESKPLETKP